MKSLCKLFYADPQAYAAAYEKRFHDPDTVHLDLCIGENPAFFCQTTDLYRRMLSFAVLCRELHCINFKAAVWWMRLC